MTQTASPLMTPGKVANTARVALIVAIAHGFTDLYQAVLLPLLPRIMDKLGDPKQ